MPAVAVTPVRFATVSRSRPGIRRTTFRCCLIACLGVYASCATKWSLIDINMTQFLINNHSAVMRAQSALVCVLQAEQVLRNASRGLACYSDGRCVVADGPYDHLRGPTSDSSTCFSFGLGSGCVSPPGGLNDTLTAGVPCNVSLSCMPQGWADGNSPNKSAPRPQGVKYTSDGCFLASTFAMTWCAAYQYCLDVGGKLYAPTDPQKYMNFTGIVSGTIWVGAVRMPDNSWMWLSNGRGLVVAADWNPGQPNEQQAYCGYMDTSLWGLWDATYGLLKKALCSMSEN
ncbi:uncharacterized protein LOC125178045 isoform X1 [Hyalella azteca]|uniref:Uncharacterized protein LOC125178045 isoform X1 n=1 Tax=Hyalella azteca TaxID=294128 RepID=A0A979FKY1_HYAAZ|nr:uncharacterized protein LOC125178045 isoform X1 [Hyalella azteca]